MEIKKLIDMYISDSRDAYDYGANIRDSYYLIKSIANSLLSISLMMKEERNAKEAQEKP